MVRAGPYPSAGLPFYSALALSRQLTPETFSADYRRSIHHHYDKIALWARINPGTFADKEALIYAEIVRLDGMNSIALKQYERRCGSRGRRV